MFSVENGRRMRFWRGEVVHGRLLNVSFLSLDSVAASKDTSEVKAWGSSVEEGGVGIFNSQGP